MQKTQLIFGKSPRFKSLIERVDKYAMTNFPVLILGETGVGKDLLAKRIHERSCRAKNPLVPINCSAIPSGLFESELFGYERGAFSGANLAGAKGLVRAASGGTLFLDEVGELDLNAQAKLLRFLDSGEVRSIGSSRVEQVDVRIIAATNVDLNEAAAIGLFRKDLLERLSVLTIEVPPLRDRPQDVALIAYSQLAELGTEITNQALQLLSQFHWPGNVRQLRNFLIRAVLRCPQEISVDTVRALLSEERSRERQLEALPENASLKEIEKEIVVERIRRHHGNRTMAAKTLKISKSSLQDKLRKWKRQDSGFADRVPTLSPGF